MFYWLRDSVANNMLCCDSGVPSHTMYRIETESVNQKLHNNHQSTELYGSVLVGLCSCSKFIRLVK